FGNASRHGVSWFSSYVRLVHTIFRAMAPNCGGERTIRRQASHRILKSRATRLIACPMHTDLIGQIRMTPRMAIAWLKECQCYFRKKDDEEASMVNAENAGKIAELLEVIAEERAHFKGALEDIIDAWK